VKWTLLLLLTAGAARAQRFPLDVSDVALQFTGYVQADGVLLDQSAEDELDPATREPLNTERILIRRAHARLDASKGRYSVWLELDANTIQSPSLSLFAAEVRAQFGDADPGGAAPLLLGVGLTRIPFGYETRQHDLDRPFLEQSSVNRALFPGSMQLGLRGRGAFRFLRYDVALMSGEPRNAAQFALQAPTHAVDVMGRGGIFAELFPGVTLDAGFSALEGNGFHPGTPTTKDTIVWRDQNGDGVVQLDEIQIIPGTAAEPSSTFRRFAVGFDAHLSAMLPFGRMVVGGEAIWAKNLDRGLYPADPVATGRDARENGASASIVLQDLPYGFACGVRYDRYDPDADANDAEGGARVPFDASVSTWAFMASVRLERVVRLLIEYDRNHNAFGRANDGSPASLAADALTARAEMAF
jgi:hypothetical protein